MLESKSFLDVELKYEYNIRNWLNEMSSTAANIFKQKLYYENEGSFFRWNGDISRIDWWDKDGKEHRYNYQYDLAGRLHVGNYSAPGFAAENDNYSIHGVRYNNNGNIKTLYRRGQISEGNYGYTDILSYDYISNGNYEYSNKLLRVNDNVSGTNHLSRDFKPNRQYTQNYGYDANGNQNSNSDKNIDLIEYNHLNLPSRVTFASGAGKIEYDYDADGVKRQQRFYTGTVLSSTKDYIGEFMFESGQLDYIIHEEGRVAYENSAFQYEFFVKDHLGNVRQVVRAPQTAYRIATMEPEHAEEEEELFQNIKESRQGAAEHNKTPGGYATAWLNADRGRILGPSRSQEIQEGDSIEIGVFGKYVDPKKIRLSPATFARTGMDRKIILTLGEYGQNLAAAPNEFAIANVIALVITELQQKPAPEAYMGYALYDSDSNLYEQGKVVLSKKARNKHEELVEKIAIKKDGYIETFLVNETAENVWFDQFRVMSTGPIIVQETHYDPWGLEIKELGYQYGGIKVNTYLYNGKEAIGHLGIELYDYGARMYDPVIGRWSVVDPLANHPMQIDKSPYAYGWNNPIRYIDPDGMCPNGCSKGEKEKDIYAEGAVVQNRFGASQYNDGKWKVISRTPMTENSSEGIRINGFFGGGSNGFGNNQNERTQSAGIGDGGSFALTQAGAVIGAKGYATYNDNFWTGKNGKVYSQNSLYKDYYGKGGKYVPGVQGLRNSAKIASKTASQLTSFGRVVGGAGVVLTAYDVASDGYITSGDLVQVGIGILTVATPIGWTYGVVDFGTQIFTGQSITNRIGSTFDKHLTGGVRLW